MNFKTTIKSSTLIFCCLLSTFSALASRTHSGGYLAYHYDIKVAMEEEDFKKAKSLVESLIPVLESDIAYTKTMLADEDDAYLVKNLTSKVERQEEIQQMLLDFLGEKKKNLSSFNSLDVIRELRRLSIKPKER